MENKYGELLASMNAQREKMKSLNSYQSEEHSVEYASLYWDSVCSNVDELLEKIKLIDLKSQYAQNAVPATEQDVVNLIKMLDVIHLCLIECSKIKQDQLSGEQTDVNGRYNSTSQSCFGNQISKVKQQIDLLSFEMTQLKTVNESLENIVSNYQLELAAASSDLENDEERTDEQNVSFH